ncbi:CAAX amino terminal protease [Olea europaea subsp. europaea]|uniref:CAAX amino terminal protease n=1 Tax=Olea europaea subsp. europaea TaxID=158383 RepID=A0A8S0QDX3_OLEEU|nr:CAAX amino terminal protease [Olea europaea subsp. europaea]
MRFDLQEYALVMGLRCGAFPEGAEYDRLLEKKRLKDRLVAMLAELEHNGGILKLVGIVALLWGGIRGAMSLTDKLISFMRIDKCPLIPR